MPLPAEVTEAHLEADASPAMESELCHYGVGLDAELEPNVQKDEVGVNIQGSFDPQELTPNTIPVEVPLEADALIELKCEVECSAPVAEEVLELEGSVVFRANGYLSPPLVRAIPG